MTKVRRRWAVWLAIPAMAVAAVLAVPSSPAQAAGPCYFSGGNWFADTCWGSTRPLIYEYEEYAVPKDPSSKNESNFSLWGGLEDAGGDTVLQNILSWDGSSWSIWPEYAWGFTCSTCGHDYQGTHIPVSAGQTISSDLTATNCDSSGHCTWYLTVEDVTTGEQSESEPIGSQVAFNTLLGGVMEVHSAHGCLSLPASDHVAFRDIFAVDITEAIASPKFGKSTPDPQCSMNVQYTATSADFIWTP